MEKAFEVVFNKSVFKFHRKKCKLRETDVGKKEERGGSSDVYAVHTQ